MQQQDSTQPKDSNTNSQGKTGYWTARFRAATIGFVIAILAVGVYREFIEKRSSPPISEPMTNASVEISSPNNSPKNATYMIDGVSVALVNGYAELSNPSQAGSKTIIRYFGNEAKADLDGNTEEDTVLLLTKDSGGSGTFFYVAVALRQDDSYKGSNVLLIGDRIAPQSTEIRNGVVVVNYTDRKPGEPMTEKPSVGVSAYFRWKDGVLAESPIVLELPAEGFVISNPLKVSGIARGTWYFEASFPLTLVDWDGRIIAESHAQALGEWMTEEFVPFEGTIEFTSPYKSGDPDFMKRGALILQKDNPSGLPEHDDALEISIFFAE